MPKIVRSPVQVIKNIKNFPEALRRNSTLQKRGSYFRAWYATRSENGGWVFGPSKFIGYEEMTSKKYLDNEGDLDGRTTESRLQDWFTEVDSSTSLFDELYLALSDELDAYGKSPSKKVRINILDETRDGQLVSANLSGSHSAIVDLIVAVSKTLPSEHLRDLRNRLTA